MSNVEAVRKEDDEDLANKPRGLDIVEEKYLLYIKIRLWTGIYRL